MALNSLLAEMKTFQRKKMKKTETVVRKRVDYSSVKLGRPTIDTVSTEEVPRFEPGDPAASEYLANEGYVVFRSVLSDEELLQARDMFQEWLEEVSPFRRDDISTYDQQFVADGSTGICAKRGIGQSDFMWFVRTRSKVREAFAQIWGTEDLITSFDGCGVFRPWAYEPSWKTSGMWWHIDQNAKYPEGKGYQCVQGLVNLFDCDETTGGLTVKPRTHKSHDEVCDRSPGSGHFVPISRDDDILNTPARLVPCKAGDLCLWDSRTIHCNSPGQKLPDSLPEKWGLIRIAAYVCMVPRDKASFRTLAQREKLYQEHRTTTHWPHIVRPLMKDDHAVRRLERNAEIDWLIGNRPTHWPSVIATLSPIMFAMVGKALQS